MLVVHATGRETARWTRPRSRSCVPVRGEGENRGMQDGVCLDCLLGEVFRMEQRFINSERNLLLPLSFNKWTSKPPRRLATATRTTSRPHVVVCVPRPTGISARPWLQPKTGMGSLLGLPFRSEWAPRTWIPGNGPFFPSLVLLFGVKLSESFKMQKPSFYTPCIDHKCNFKHVYTRICWHTPQKKTQS